MVNATDISRPMTGVSFVKVFFAILASFVAKVVGMNEENTRTKEGFEHRTCRSARNTVLTYEGFVRFVWTFLHVCAGSALESTSSCGSK